MLAYSGHHLHYCLRVYAISGTLLLSLCIGAHGWYYAVCQRRLRGRFGTRRPLAVTHDAVQSLDGALTLYDGAVPVPVIALEGVLLLAKSCVLKSGQKRR